VRYELGWIARLLRGMIAGVRCLRRVWGNGIGGLGCMLVPGRDGRRVSLDHARVRFPPKLP
jgi:hypothetical protein